MGSTSENLDNRNVEICSSEDEVSESYVTSVQSPFQVTLKPDINLNTSSEQSSIFSASQLISGDSSYFNSNNATRADDSTVAELMVEGYGDKTEEIGEIIEDTFKDKKIASKFGEKETEAETVTSTTTTLDLSVVEEE